MMRSLILELTAAHFLDAWLSVRPERPRRRDACDVVAMTPAFAACLVDRGHDFDEAVFHRDLDAEPPNSPRVCTCMSRKLLESCSSMRIETGSMR